MKEEKETKTPVKKTTTKKTTAKKTTTAKKPATKKATATKKPATKKTTTKKAEPATKKATTKKATTKKAATTTKKPVVKKEAVKKEVEKVEEKPVVIEEKEEKTPIVSEVKEEIKEVVSNIDTEAIKAKGRNIVDIILNVFTKPYETCKEETENREIKNSMILLVLIALSMGFMISAITYASFHITVGTLGSVADYYKVPYFKIFIVWSVISFIMSFLPIVLSHLAGIMFSKNKFTFSGLVNLYSSSMSVVILINIISGAFIFSGVFIKFFLLVSLLTLFFGVINYIFVYRDMMNFSKSKEAYIFLGIVLIWILGLVLIASLFTSGVDGLNAFDAINSTINS